MPVQARHGGYRDRPGNDHEGIDMTPGYNHGTVYVSTVPVNPAVGVYLGGGKGVLWIRGAPEGAGGGGAAF